MYHLSNAALFRNKMEQNKKMKEKKKNGTSLQKGRMLSRVYVLLRRECISKFQSTTSTMRKQNRSILFFFYILIIWEYFSHILKMRRN